MANGLSQQQIAGAAELQENMAAARRKALRDLVGGVLDFNPSSIPARIAGFAGAPEGLTSALRTAPHIASAIGNLATVNPIGAISNLMDTTGATPEQERARVESTVNQAQQQRAEDPALGGSALGAIDALTAQAIGQAGAPQSVTTTTVQRGPLSAQQAAGLFAEKKLSAELRKQTALLNQEVQNDLIGRQKDLQAQWRQESERYAKDIGRRGDVVHKRFQKLDEEFEAMRKDLKGQDIQLLGGFDRTSRALMIVAAALEGGAAAAMRRPSNTVGLLRGAINQDLAVQRANIQRRMRLMNVTERQRDNALRRWDAIEGQKRQTAARLAQLQLAELGLESKRADIQAATADQILGIGDALIDTKAKLAQASGARVTTQTVTKRGGAAPAGVGAVRLDKEDKIAKVGMEQMSKLADQTINAIIKAKPARTAAGRGLTSLGSRALGALDVQTDTGVAQGKADVFSRFLAAAISGKQMTNQEAQAFLAGQAPTVKNSVPQNMMQIADGFDQAIDRAFNSRNLAISSKEFANAREWEKTRLRLQATKTKIINKLARLQATNQ